MTIADTDVLIDFLAGQGESERVAELLKAGTLRTSVISRFELLSGARSARQRQQIFQLLGAVPTLPLDDAATDSAVDVRQALERSGNPIGMADSLIAGVALANGAELLTRNKRHFERVPRLKLA